MLKKYCGSLVPKIDSEQNELDEKLKKDVMTMVFETKKQMETNFDVSKALDAIFEIFSKANKYIEETEPYKLAKLKENKSRLDTVMRNLLECIRIGTILLSAFLPDCSTKVLDALNVTDVTYKNAYEFYSLKESDEIKELSILFPRLDTQKELEELAKIAEQK